jgi:hypothetical protein
MIIHLTEPFMAEMNSLLRTTFGPVRQFLESLAQEQHNSVPADLPNIKTDDLVDAINFLYQQLRFQKEKLMTQFGTSQQVYER